MQILLYICKKELEFSALNCLILQQVTARQKAIFSCWLLFLQQRLNKVIEGSILREKYSASSNANEYR